MRKTKKRTHHAIANIAEKNSRWWFLVQKVFKVSEFNWNEGKKQELQFVGTPHHHWGSFSHCYTSGKMVFISGLAAIRSAAAFLWLLILIRRGRIGGSTTRIVCQNYNRISITSCVRLLLLLLHDDTFEPSSSNRPSRSSAKNNQSPTFSYSILLFISFTKIILETTA